MSGAANIELYEAETTCVYRGETYRVRDNGAVLRQRQEDKRKRPLDETWTFGKPSASDGYMAVSAHKVHRIVATAFHGPQPSKSHVVDHIDTNRRNNRPENLRWVTRLENILLNPVTAKRVVQLYGSIEDFLADPRNPRNGTPATDFEWMRTVSADEAAYSRERLMAWAKSDKPSGGGTIGDWVFGRSAQPEPDPADQLVESKTAGAVQRNWQVPATFPACPKTSEDAPLSAYFERLKTGTVFSITPFGQGTVGKAALSQDGAALFILGEHGEDAIKPWSLAKVTFEDGAFVHESCGTFFQPDGAEKAFTLIQGLPWEGGDTFDDYC